MVILTALEVAALREAYMRSLATALLRGNVPHWNSATDAERAEVRIMVSGWHKLPDEERQALEYREMKDAEARSERKRPKMAIGGEAAAKKSAKSPEKPSA